jgi:uncharacterized protein
MRPARESNAAEFEAYARVVEQLKGFDSTLIDERIEGMLCALAAASRPAPAEEWLEPLFGDAWPRAFADPQAHTEALRALSARLAVFRDQLDPEALFDDIETLRLNPVIVECTDAMRQDGAQAGLRPEAVAVLQTGFLWADGFLDAVEKLPALWAFPPGEDAQAAFEESLQHIEALTELPDSEALREHIARNWRPPEPDGGPPAAATPSRDDLLAEALYAVQDLRMYWIDFATLPETRRVAPTPGRNDPCPCGSGKKYKKCHGAAA